MNFFKLYIGDYQRDTGTLTLAEHGAYLLMLQHYYATEKPLPSGKELFRLLRAENKAEKDAISKISCQFWKETDAGLVNDRAWEEIQKGIHQREVNQSVGKKGGRPKRTESKTESVTESKAIHNPNQTPDTRELSNDNSPPKPPKGISVVLPSLISHDQWKRWLSFRKAIKKPVSQETAEEQIRQLTAWAERGHDPNEILATSIRNSWQGLFEPKTTGNGNGFNQKPDNSVPAKIDRAIAERNARRQAEGAGPSIGTVIEGEFDRIAF